MPEYKTYKDLWKYCTSDQCREMLLSLKLFGNTEWTGEKQISCLYALSNHVEKHYHRVKIPKSSGEVRFLDVPDPLLKQVQKNILHHVLEGFSVSPAAAAYHSGASPLANASLHTGNRLVLKLDIHDFFGSIIFPMVLGSAFPGEYFPMPVRMLLTHLCCYKEILPQGAPTSPAISNLVMKPFDDYMSLWCQMQQITYSRYSDDMTFSGDFEPGEVIRRAGGYLHIMGMELNRKKTRLCSNGSRQTVTGIVVNEKPQLPRDYKRRLRQEIYYCRKYGVKDHLKYSGIDNPSPEHIKTYLQSLLGKVLYLLSVNNQDCWFAEAEQYLRQELKELIG